MLHQANSHIVTGLLRNPRLALVASLFTIAGGGFFASQLKFDNSLEAWFLDDDPALESYRHFLDLFESDEVVIVAWRDPDLLTDAGLRRVAEVTAMVADLDDVLDVTSLTNVNEIRDEDGAVLVANAVTVPLPPTESRADLIQRLQRNPMIGGILLSEDAQMTAVVARIVHREGDIDYKFALAANLREQVAAREAREGRHYFLGGAPIFDDAFFRYTERDSAIFLPAMLLLIVLVMFALFRSGRALLYPLTVILGALAVALGLMSLAGIRLTIIHTIIAPLLLAVGIADAVHLLSLYARLRREGADATSACREAMQGLLMPCLVTSATTAVGLLSLLTADLAPLREFGVVGAAGVVAAFLFTFTTAPVLLPLMRVSASNRTATRLEGLLAAISETVVRRPWPVVVVSVIAAAALVSGCFFLKIGTNSLEYFKTNDPVYQDTLVIDTNLGGAFSLEVLLTADADGALKEPQMLRKMLATQRDLEAVPGVAHAISLADVVLEIDRALTGHDPGQIPDTAAAVAQYLLLIEGEADLEKLVDLDYRHGRISARVQSSAAELAAREVPKIRRMLRERFADGVTAKSTGLVELMSNMETYLLQSQIRAFGLAFILIIGIMSLALRSWRLGLFSAIPNLLPIAMTLGLMGWIGIRLDAGTVMIAPIALGLVVDDTVHFLHHVQVGLRRRLNLTEAIHATMRFTGVPIVFTSVILVCGFWTMLAASFRPNIHFGALCGVAIIFAVIADLLLLPALLVLVRPNVGNITR